MAHNPSSDESSESVRCRYCGQRNQTTPRDGQPRCGRCRLPLSDGPHKKFASLDKDQYIHPADSRALAACTQFGGDVLIVESEHDFVVPHQVLMNYREACSRARSVTYRVMAGTDHGLTEEVMHHAYTSLLVEWFRHMLAESPVTSETTAPVA